MQECAWLLGPQHSPGHVHAVIMQSSGNNKTTMQ
jgi:hypothetical protein